MVTKNLLRVALTTIPNWYCAASSGQRTLKNTQTAAARR